MPMPRLSLGRKLAKGRPDSSLFFWLAIERYDRSLVEAFPARRAPSWTD
jgi:hypothetical protein